MNNTFNNFQECTAFIEEYPKCFKRANVTASILWNLDKQATITETYTKYENGKITKNTTRNISAREYACVITGIVFFDDRTYKSYTPFGNIATKLIARCPYDDIKVTRTYNITANR